MLIKSWLTLCAIMVILMIFVGGLTRLTGSGLSIVEWKPITGIIPPLNDETWEREFADYKTSPEYQKLNKNFILEDFKNIFWLEFIHRILGRITGLIIILPVIYFGFRKQLPSLTPYISMCLLVIFQGFIGWYMVKSGLIDNPHVSHYRLAAHMITAVILYSVILWQIFVVWRGALRCYPEEQSDLGIQKNYTTSMPQSRIVLDGHATLAMTILLLVYLQIFLGAMTAGLDAGMVYNEFPLMGAGFVPFEFEWEWKIFDDPVCVQFLHRSFAYAIFISCIFLSWQLRRYNKFLAWLLVLTVLTQLILGILTLLYLVPIKLALAHQLFAVLLVSIILYIIHCCIRRNCHPKFIAGSRKARSRS